MKLPEIKIDTNGHFSMRKSNPSADQWRTSVITYDHAVQLADLFEKHDINPHSADYDHAYWDEELGRKVFPSAWLYIEELHEACNDLPDFWTLDVASILNIRSMQRAKQQLEEKIAGIDNDQVRAFVWAKHEEHEVTRIGATDERGLAQRARKNGWSPDGECGAKLKLSEGVVYKYEQQAYADMTYIAIPVEGDTNLDKNCARNLRSFCDHIRTHTGLAGSGCTYDMKIDDEHRVVILEIRASICE